MMKNDKIVEAWNEINPDDVTKNEIFSEIMKRQNKHTKHRGINKAVVIAAAIPLTLILMGAAANVIKMVYYDMNGNIHDIPESSAIRFEPGTEEFEFEQALRDSKEDNALIIKVGPEENIAGATFPVGKTIEDYEEFKDYLHNNGGEMFMLPEYIPAGFEFESAHVYLVLSADADYEALEPIYCEEKFGNIYEKYLLPEDQTRVDRVIVNYNNGSIYLSCHIYYLFGNAITGRTSEVMTEPEILDMPQFERCMIMSYKNGDLNPNPMWVIAADKKLDEPVYTLSDGIFYAKANRCIPDNLDMKSSEEYNYVHYSIDASSTMFAGISREEIIKVMESIK